MERLRKFDGKLLLITLCTVVLSMFLGYTAPKDARAAGGNTPIPLTITVEDSSGQKVDSLTVTLSQAGGIEEIAVSTGMPGQVKFDDVSSFVDSNINELSGKLKIEYTDGTGGHVFENKEYKIANINEIANQTKTVTLPDYSAAKVEAKTGLTYNGSEQELITATGTDFSFKYELKDAKGDYVAKNDTKQKDAGTYDYRVTITEKGNTTAFSEIRNVEAKIGKKPVTLKFEDGAPTEKKWFDDPFTLTVKSNPDVPSGTTYTYTSSTPGNATVDTAGKVTPVKPGITKIEATFTDPNYDVTPATLNFTVKKADAGDVAVTFDKDLFEQVYNASGTFSQNAKVTLKNTPAKDVTVKAKISYLIEGTDNTAEAFVSDSTKSEVTYKKIGEATVKASLGDNDWFDFTAGSEPSQTYKATIKGADLPAAPYTIEGTKINDNTVADYDCFKDSFTIKPAAGYQIAAYDSVKELKDQDFKNELYYTEAVSKLYDKETIQYVLKDSAGSITDIQKVKEVIGIDQTKPAIDRFDITTEGDLLYNLTFGLFGKSRIKVTVTATDGSPSGGIADIKLYGPQEDKEIVTKEALSNSFDGYKSTATKVFYIDPKDHQDNFGGYLWAVATDKADHSSEKTKADGSNSLVDTEQLKHGEGYFNIETIKPVYQNVSYAQNTDVSSGKTGDIQHNGIYTTGANTKINFDLKDSDSGLKDFTIKANGEELSAKNVEVEKNTDNITYPSNYNTIEKSLQGIYKYTIKTESGNFYKSNGSDVIPAGTDGSYAIELKATDHAGNESILNFTLKQDKTTAVVTDFAFKPTTIPEKDGNSVPVDAAKNEYGFFVNETTEVTITAKDIASDKETASGVKTITYKAVGDANIPETTAAVDSEGKIRFNVSPNFKGQIYAYATDNMGQSTDLYKNKADTNPLHLPNGFTDGQFDQNGFCHPLGLIVENSEQHKSLSSIGINDPNKNDGYITEKMTGNPFEGKGIEGDKDLFDYKNNELKVYNGLSNLNFQLSVSDTYSGIRQIETKVFDGSLATLVTHDTTTVDSNGNVDPASGWSNEGKESNLLVSSTKTINLSPSKYKEQTVFIQVILTDNAGNQTYNYYPFAIDKTNPTVDSFTVEKNNADPVSKFLNKITFGYFFNETVEVLVTTSDDKPSAGITEAAGKKGKIVLKGKTTDNTEVTFNEIKGSFSERKTLFGNNYETQATKKFNVSPNFKGSIYAVVTDNADLSSKEEESYLSKGMIVEDGTYHVDKATIVIDDKNNNDGYSTEKMTGNPFENKGIAGDKNLFNYQDHELKVHNGLSSLNFELTITAPYSGIKQIETKIFDGSLATPVNTYYDMTTVDSDGNVNAESDWTAKEGDKESNLLVKSTRVIELVPSNFNEETVFIQVVLTDNAGNQTYNYYPFAIDKTNPTVDSFTVDRKNAGPASKLLNKITFGHFFNETVEVSVTTSDDKPSAGITEAADKKGKIVLKGKTTDNKEVTFDEIKGGFNERKPSSGNNYETQSTKKFNVSPDFKGSIYAVVTDNAGLSSKPEESYLSKGMIVEDSDRHYKEASIEISDPNDNKEYVQAVLENNPFEGKGVPEDKEPFDYKNKELKVYNGRSKLDFQLSVSDPYSGIKQIETKVFDGSPDTSVDTYHDMTTVDSNGNVNAESAWSAKEEDKESNLLISSTKTIQINPSDFKNETVLIQVILTDNAGNQSYNYYPFAIDKTNPTVDKFEIEHIHDQPIDKILNNLTFGLFFNEELCVTVTTSDNGPSGGISNSGSIAVWGKTADDKDILVDPVDRGFNETKPSKANGYKTTSTKKYILPLEFDGYLYAQVKDNAELLSPKTQAVGPGEKGKPANTTVDGEILADLKGYINLEAHVPNIFETAAENEASLVNDKEPNGQFTNDQVKQINGVHKDETFTRIDGRDYITGDATLSFVVQDKNSGLREVAIEVNEKEIAPSAVTINDGEKAYSFKYVEYSASEGVDKPFREKDRYVINTAGIAPDENGEYRVKVTVTDNAGNVSTLSRTFYKDITTATVTDFTFTPADHDEGTNKPINAVETDYGYYFRDAADVTITATDNKYPQDHEAVSGLASITYVAKDIEGAIISGKDVAVDGNGKVYFRIPANFKGQIYAYATDKLGQSADKVVSGAFNDAGLHWPADYDDDKAGNRIVIQKDGPYPGYVHPSGSIVENNAQHHKTSDIQITAPGPVGREDHSASYSYTTQMDKVPAYDASQMVPLYNDGFNFDINVGDSYSGIREITWTVIEGGADQSKATVTVQNDGSLTGDAGGWSINEQDENLVTRMSTRIPVSGNYNDMVLRVDLTDRSGNQSYDYYMFGIDTTAPTINISYDNNNGDSIGAKEANHAYYNADRIATITVTERNFDPSRVNVHATSNGGAMPVGLSWSDSQAGGNGDGSTHVAQIVYSDDADYTFTMDCMDRANRTNSGIDYGSSLTPENFTVDKTLPVVTVTYDNNDAANGKYFKANRTATITVQEHNFDVNRMTTQITAMLDGQGIGVPVVSWSGGGDTNIGTVAFNTDGDYTLNVTEARDAAGNAFTGPNYSATAAQDFTVDTKIEKPVIRGVENEHAYKDDFAIGFDILDINFDTDTIQLLRTRYNEKDKDVTADFLTHISRTDKGDVADGNTIEKKQDYDGIYTLNLSVTDKATNTESATVTFSVNRFGSVYVYDAYLSSILDGYVQKVDQGLVITEYNPDRLLQNSLQLQATRDSAPMKDLRYTVSPAISNTATVGESGWYQYRYSINADNFEKDGIYAVTVASKDEAGNQPANTSYPDKDILFRVDSVAPELMSVTGLEKDTINAIKANVEYKAFDAIALDEVSVYVNNERVDYVNTFEDLTTYSGKFSIDEGVRQNVRLVLKDKAGNVLNTADADFKVSFPFERTVTVSTNPFVRWFSNIYRTIGTTAVGIIAIGFCVYLLLKKGKAKGSSDNESTK